jgi:hypothetical protein
MMTVGQMGTQHPSLAAMVTAVKAPISRIALHRRFSQAAAAFMFKCLLFVMRYKIDQAGILDTRLLNNFSRVMVFDSTGWDVHEKLRSAFPGSGGAASAANCKLQAVYDYTHGELRFLDLTSGILPDSGYTDKLAAALDPGDLALFDQGYFKVNTLRDIAAKEAFFLSRFNVSTSVKDAITGKDFDLLARLSETPCENIELSVTLGGRTQESLNCRIIALPVNQQIADERRRRLMKASRKRGHICSKYHLELCAWTILVTNVPAQWLPMEMARALYTLRWQIELVFKQLKSVLQIHRSNTANEYRLRCEIYGRLIMAIMVYRLHAEANIMLWNTRHKEVSMDKLYKRLQERAFILMEMLLDRVDKAADYLRREIKRILPACLKNSYPSRMTTLEMLEAQYDQKIYLTNFRCLG